MTTEPSDAETPAEVITATSTEAQLPSPAEGLSVLPPDHWTEVAQNAQDDVDSTLGEDVAQSTASLTSSILRYRTIQGRTYHTESGSASYW